MALHRKVIDVRFVAKVVNETLSDDVHIEKVDRILSEWNERGLFDQNITSKVCTPANLASPHYLRSFDYQQLPSRIANIFAEASMLVFILAADERLSINVIEFYLLKHHASPDVRRNEPVFYDNFQRIGMGAAFLLLAPLIWYMRDTANFSFSESAVNEAMHIDIGKGVDSSYLRMPTSYSFFSLPKTLADYGYFVHDAATGLHQLDGIYVEETADHGYEISPDHLDLLGFDAAKPIRCLTIILTGQPMDTVGNDTMFNVELFLQDELSIDNILSSTIRFYMGETYTSDASTHADIACFENKLNDSHNVDINRNVMNIKGFVNLLCYLNLADYRKTESKERTQLDAIISGYAKKRKSKSAKKLHGKADLISISSTNPAITGSTSNGHVPAFKISSHFRRGHIRNQRYGSAPNFTHKPLFIKPTIVAQNAGGGDPKPKNYNVS